MNRRLKTDTTIRKQAIKYQCFSLSPRHILQYPYIPQGGDAIKQPTLEENTERVNQVLAGKCDREPLNDWAFESIENDRLVEVEDVEARHYLVAVSGLDLMAAP